MKNITKTDIVDFLKQQVALKCSVPYDTVDTHIEFVEFRMDSLKAVYIMDRLEKFIGKELSPLYFWDHPTIDSLSEFIVKEILNT
ncbi:MAG: acyl carrier protein [Cyclobacteriaceae bacterium]